MEVADTLAELVGNYFSIKTTCHRRDVIVHRDTVVLLHWGAVVKQVKPNRHLVQFVIIAWKKVELSY